MQTPPPATFRRESQDVNAGKTIAVLPFVNLSASSDNEYFSDGITEEIISALSKLKELKVTSRTSSFYFKNKNVPVKEIAKTLNVSAIVEGSVRQSGNMLRITAQLIHAGEDYHFWSESWDRKLDNIFEIQDEISLLIADKLRENLGHFEILDQLVEKQTANIEAYEYFLKGKFHANKWNPEDMNLAIFYYEKALEIDPKHAESYLGLANCYGFMATTGFLPHEESWKKTIELTSKALSLNDGLPAGHYQLAQIAFFTACDYSEAFQQTEKAIALKPNYADAQQFMSFLYIIAGEKEKAYEHLQISLSIDPLSQETQFYSAYFSYMVADYTAALEKLDKCLENNPKNIPVHAVKCYCLLKMQRCDEVINYFDATPSYNVMPADKIGLTALAYAIKRDPGNTARLLDQLLDQSRAPDGFRAYTYLLLMYGVTGDNDKAFEWIEQAMEKKSSLLLFNFADPLVDAIKDDPRYSKFHKIIYETADQARTPSNKKKELLGAQEAAEYASRLMDHMKNETPFLDPDLSLRSLAEQIAIHPNQLSWLLNENMGRNFNEFVNHYRVEAFKALAKDPAKAHITLIGLAYESGFNSKTVFNASFKKETGLTPKQYLGQ